MTSAWPGGCLIFLSRRRSASPSAGACSRCNGSATTRRRRCRPGCAHPACHQPGRHPHRRDAGHRSARAGPARRLVRLPAPAPRLHQPRPAHPPRAPARAPARGHDQRADQLRPASAAHPRPHRAHPRHLSATRSPPPAPARQHSSPASPSGCSSTAWPSSPTPALPRSPGYAPPSAPTTSPSTTSPSGLGSPPNPRQLAHKAKTTHRRQT
jgi:hypothetical protein